MKKTILFFTIFLILMFNNVFVFAAFEDGVDNSFYITGGLDFSKEAQATFDKTRTITGKADEGTTVLITVYEKLPQKKQQLKEIETYNITVGASGYFNQTIDLVFGENVINIDFKQGKKTDSISTSITRKKSEIKNELEQAIILPRARR